MMGILYFIGGTVFGLGVYFFARVSYRAWAEENRNPRNVELSRECLCGKCGTTMEMRSPRGSEESWGAYFKCGTCENSVRYSEWEPKMKLTYKGSELLDEKGDGLVDADESL